MPPVDPCPLADRQVCEATRDLARALLRRLSEAAARVEPRIKTIVATRDGDLRRYSLWRLHGDNGRLLFEFDPSRPPGAAWSALAADVSTLACLADLRLHPPGYYYVHPTPAPHDVAIPLLRNPRGLAPRTLGPLQRPSGQTAGRST
ncbi:hypothetical protein ABZ626_03530 [Streptomyces longispororuber]|uniref:hypothetical protein n=1 Tax=Streptomyces longispororuber TaxID=68230 RepID=UPI00340E51F9